MTTLASDSQYKNLGEMNNGKFHPHKHEQAVFISESLSYLEQIQEECNLPEEVVLESELAILRRFEIIDGVPNEESSLTCAMTVCTEPNELSKMVNFGKIWVLILLLIYIGKEIKSLIQARIKMVANSIEMHQIKDDDNKSESNGKRVIHILSKISEITLILLNVIILAMPPELYERVICKT